MARQPDVRYINYYTVGSAARKVAPVEPLKMLKLPRVSKRRHKRMVLHIDPIAVAGIVVSAMMLVFMAIGLVQLNHARENTAVMQSYVDTLRHENKVLAAEYENGYDLEEVEKMALALGLVPQDQVEHITIRVPDAEPVEEPSPWERFYAFLTGLFA